MEDMALGRIAALVPEFAVKDLPLGRTLMMITELTGGLTENLTSNRLRLP